MDNFTEGINKIKYKDCDCFLKHESVKNNFIKYRCLSGSNDYSNKIDKELKLSLLIMLSIHLFCCQEKVFVFMII